MILFSPRIFSLREANVLTGYENLIKFALKFELKFEYARKNNRNPQKVKVHVQSSPYQLKCRMMYRRAL